MVYYGIVDAITERVMVTPERLAGSAVSLYDCHVVGQKNEQSIGGCRRQRASVVRRSSARSFPVMQRNSADRLFRRAVLFW